MHKLEFSQMMAGENALNPKRKYQASNVQVGKMSTFKRLKTKTENIKLKEKTVWWEKLSENSV